jgi:hypothetical protein
LLTLLLWVISPAAGARPAVLPATGPSLAATAVAFLLPAAAAISLSPAAAAASSGHVSLAVGLPASLSKRLSARCPDAITPLYHAESAPLLADVLANFL